MYSRNQIARLKHGFWTSFGRYMLPVQSAGYEKVNWVNYKTGVKGIFFKMEVGLNGAILSIQITGDELQRKNSYQKLLQLKNVFENSVPGNWEWVIEKQDENGQFICTIESTLTGVNITDKNDWPEIISFLKSGMIGLDKYWNAVNDFF